MTNYFQQIQLRQHLPINTQGRDFVMGDLHGCLRSLNKALDTVGFDKSIDRLFVTGDLIDRGFHSIECLKLIQEEWFYSIMGNHELMMIGAFWRSFNSDAIPAELDYCESSFYKNGGKWMIDYLDGNGMPDTEISELLHQVSRLPVILTVGEGEQRFNLVHSQLLPNETDANMDNLPELVPTNSKVIWHIIEVLLWERQLMKSDDTTLPAIQPGLSTTYVGHTIGKTIQKRLSHVNLDTGAFLNELLGDDEHGLTIVEANQSTLYPLIQINEPNSILP
jgi:serine/threonine protein phosphatase 1